MEPDISFRVYYSYTCDFLFSVCTIYILLITVIYYYCYLFTFQVLALYFLSRVPQKLFQVRRSAMVTLNWGTLGYKYSNVNS